MAQGKFKTKKTLPNQQKAKRKKFDIRKSKGRAVIAPKKAKLLDQYKFKKSIETAMRGNIESEVVAKASVAEPKSLRMVNQPSTSQDEPSRNK